MRIQLFVPPQGYVAQRWSEGSSMPPLGILFLASVLEQEGFEVMVVPSDVLGDTWQEVEQRIVDFRPAIVGITTTTENRFDSFKLAKIVKRVSPSTLTVLGGPHISMAGEDTISHVKQVDVLVVGEGERTIVELARTIKEGGSLKNVPGIYFRDTDGQIVATGRRSRIEELDDLPFPARHKIPMDKYNFFVETRDGKKRRAQNLMTSRGCPFNCYFCATPINWGRKMRGHSPERVVEEVEHLVDQYGAEFIWFYDDTLNYNAQRLHKIMDMIIERKLNIKFANEFRIDIIDKPLLEKMREAGLERGYFGVEAGAKRVRNDVVLKTFEIDKAYQFVQWAKELDFIPGPFFIFSHHTETWDEAQETIGIMEKVKDIHPQADISTAILHVYPGTPVEKIAKDEKIMPKNFSWAKKSDMSRVHTLPAAQGYVPLFKHRLSWRQIAELIMRFSSTGKKVVSWKKIANTISSLTSAKELWINFVFFTVLVKNRIKKRIGRTEAK
jgi:radical SAM superfamily enzyme YgiQ (UPF0313 family)